MNNTTQDNELLSKVLNTIFNKEKFKKYYSTYLFVITFFLFLFLQILISGFEIVLIVYTFMFAIYSIFKLMK
jgi:hypothetical protein